MATLILLTDIVWDGTVNRGGHTMCELQWLHGLERLGHRVLFLDLIGQDFGPRRESMLAAYAEVIDQWWRRDCTALIDTSSMSSLFGLSVEEVKNVSDKAAAIITLGAPGRKEACSLIEKVRPRLMIDRDPVYTQSWIGGDIMPADIYGEQDLYFTVGVNIGTTRCRAPSFGIDWKPMWNPVVLDWWGPPTPPTHDRFTTISDWYTQGYIQFEGQVLGPKVEEFRKFIDLPKLAGEALEIALLISPDDPDIERLSSCGWVLESPERVRTPAMFRDYVMGSAGEVSCAKGGYARTNCGWFSDRSACYLAAGRPVIVQATGASDVLPVGKGLFSFSDLEEAAGAIKAVRRDYAAHCRAARALAEEHFDSDKVLANMLKLAGIESPPGR
jgi:hypothetical protein